MKFSRSIPLLMNLSLETLTSIMRTGEPEVLNRLKVLSIDITLVEAHLAELHPLPYSCERSTRSSNRFHNFLSPFVDAIRIPISTVLFLAQLNWWILCLQNAFLWLMIYGYWFRVNKHLLFLGSFYSLFL